MSHPLWSLCIMSSQGTEFVDIHGLTAIGGTQSSGITVSSLKYKDDYVIVSPTSQGISIHTLKGRRGSGNGNEQLSPYKHFSLLDLSILLLPKQLSHGQDAGETDGERFSDDVRVLVQKFSQPGDLKGAMALLLETMLSSYEMDKGLVIASNAKGEFQMMAEENISKDEPWLSETLVQQTIRLQKPTIVQNIIGSSFEASKSLMATGFMSVCAWPLSVRGQILGVLVIGSDRPHSGINEKQLATAEAYVQLGALMLKFYLNDMSLKREVASLRESHFMSDCPIKTNDGKLRETIQLAKQVADTDLALLVLGETGVGKELMAQWIHRTSSRKNSPMIAVNCGAIPADLLESLLFGHRKGAFTGAIKDQRGKFEQAQGGTIFLDEIGDLPGALQAKILRVLQEKVVEPLGSEKSIKVDVRIISATHQPLQKLVEEGLFRQDLYYRLAEVSLTLPPLRERRDDILLMAHSVLKKMGSEKRFSSESVDWLISQDWKGNVRELISAVKRAAALSMEGDIEKHHLSMGGAQSEKQNSLGWLGGENLEEAKTFFVLEKVKLALSKAQNNKTKAAELLGVTPRTLFRYLEDKP